MSSTPSYNAFMSYSHSDSRIAGRIHRYIQNYRLPDHTTLKVYRDVTDIRSGDLSSELTRALHESGSLLVCCSPSTPDSRWVQKEVAVFDTLEGDRTVIPIIVAGDPEQVMPPALVEKESRYIDLRGKLWGGLLSPSARIELSRGIATVARLPLRDLINWEKRRQRQFTTWTAALVLTMLAGILLFPLNYQRPLDLAKRIRPIETVEFAEVQKDGALTVMVREIMEGGQGTRNYVAYYPDALMSEERNWLDDGNFMPRTRLLPARVLPYRLGRNLAKQFDIKSMLNQAQKQYRASVEEWMDAEALDSDQLKAPGGPWFGEPAPGLTVALVTIPPPPADPADEAFESPAVGDAVVAVHRAGGAPRVARVQGLEPVFTDIPGGLRSFDLNNGIPVAAYGENVWIGLPVRPNGAMGGLWNTGDGGKSWRRVDRFASVASVAVSPGPDRRVLVATAPGPIRSGIREARIAAQCWEWVPDKATWKALDPAPPFSSDSRIHFAGFLPDGSAVVLVDAVLHQLGRDNLAQRLLGQ